MVIRTISGIFFAAHFQIRCNHVIVSFLFIVSVFCRYLLVGYTQLDEYMDFHYKPRLRFTLDFFQNGLLLVFSLVRDIVSLAILFVCNFDDGNIPIKSDNWPILLLLRSLELFSSSRTLSVPSLSTSLPPYLFALPL